MAVTGARTVGSLVAPGEAEAYHFCGHIYTTDSCPHPTGLPRIDSKGRPLRAKDGHRVDDLGPAHRPRRRSGRRGRQAAHRRRGRAAARRLAHAGLQGRRRALRNGARRSTARGTAAAAGTCASSSTAAPTTTTASTATARCGATATRAGACSASCTSRRRSRAEVLTWALAAAALAAGVTGAWSPCGFSMVETLAPAGYAGRLRTTLVACFTFTLGALAGGVLTFGGLATLGEALGAGGTGAAVVAAAIAVAAGGRRGARRADRPAGPPPGPGVVAARAAGPARRRPVRGAARPRLHDLHPHVRGVGARGRQRGARRPGDRAPCSGSPSAPAARCP